MDYIVPAALLGITAESQSTRDDDPPLDGVVDREATKKQAYIRRIQRFQTAGTIVLVPVMLILQVPFLRFADNNFSPSVAITIRRSFLRGSLAGNLAFAVADIVPHTGLEICGLTIIPQLLPNTPQGMNEVLGVEQAVLTWPCRRERIRQEHELLCRLDCVKRATPLVKDLLLHMEHEMCSLRKERTLMQGVAKFIGEALVLFWEIYKNEKERGKARENEEKEGGHNDDIGEQDEAASLAFRGAAAWDI